MRYEIIECIQNSPEWYEARRGMPTASRYKDVMAQGEGKMRSKYMRQLCGEIISGKPMVTYSNDRMEDGKKFEPWLRAKYWDETDSEVKQVGFVKLNPELCITGCSPDGLVGDQGMVEFKSVIPENLVEIIDTGKMPTGHQAQIQGCMWILGRKWTDLVFGHPDMNMIKIFRIVRDEHFMASLINELKMFNIELRRLVERIKDA